MKKVPPKKQTEELRRAKLEFLKRNPDAWRNFQEHPVIAEFKEWFEANYRPINEEDFQDIEEVFQECMHRPAAADASLQFLSSWCKAMEIVDEHPLTWAPEEKGERYKEQILEDAREHLECILGLFQNPGECLLVACDLTRSKKVIMAEFETVLDRELDIYRKDAGVEWVETADGWKKEPLPESRIKWLSRADEILEVWDLYTRAGRQSAIKTFAQIARKVGRPVNTVKSQWRLAYEKIYGHPYSPDLKFSSEEMRREADALCAACTDPKCYRKTGGGDSISWFPCKEYLELAGVERKLKTVELADWLLSKERKLNSDEFDD